MLVKYRTELTVEAESGRRIKKNIYWGDGGKAIFVRTGHQVNTVRP